MRKKFRAEAYINTSRFSLEIGRGKRILFSFLLFLIAVGVLLLAEGVLRLINYGGDLRLFVPAPKEVSDYYRCNPDIGKRYFYRQFTIPIPPKDLFLKEKPVNGYRIFVLGGSTTAGFPYANNLMFSRILWRRLQDAFPEKRIEMVNTALTAVNSYTMLDFIDEILENEPDLILIYAGHNEFYGALGVASLESLGQSRWLIKTYLKIEHLRLFRLLRALISKVGAVFQRNHAADPEDLTATLMERIVSEQFIPLGSELYERGKAQFRSNLEEILKQADQANVPIVLSELVSNVGDQPPFSPVQSDTFPSAEQVYKQAQQLEARGDYTKARQLYLRAKDLDALRFRATEDFNAVIHESASRYKLTVVPMKRIFEENSSHGIVGNELILEHLHPNLDGYFLMAEGFYRTLRAAGYIDSKWDSSHMRPVAVYKKDWGVTELDTVYGNLSIYWLKGGWPFQPKELQNTSLETYIPENKVDSVALKVLVDKEIGVEMGHVELARYYQDRKAYRKAYQEYRALIYTIPHEVMFYEGAAKMLLKLNQEDEALSILKESLLIRENDFALKWLSYLYLKQGNVDTALFYLAKATPALTKDQEFLNILAHVYIASGQFDKFLKTLEYLYSLKGGSLLPFPYNASANKRHLAQQYISAASLFLKERDFRTVFALLTQSLRLDETAFANKWIGQILLARKEFRKALPYLQKAESMGLKDPDLYYNLAAANYYLDQKKKAVLYFNKLKQIRPDHPDPAGLLDKINPD
jgi:tetratricopeptide (TPR) repeat protein